MPDTPHNDGYQSLIDEGIDELNSAHNFAATSLKSEEKKIKWPLPEKEKITLGLLAFLVVLNGALYAYFSSSSNPGLSAAQANKQLAEIYEEEEAALQALQPLINAASNATLSRQTLKGPQAELAPFGITMPPEEAFKTHANGFWAEK